MATQLVTDQLSNVLDDTFRSQLIGNFKAIEKALNDLNAAKANLNSNQDANIEAIVNILSDYDVPIKIVNGKVVDTKEGE